MITLLCRVFWALFGNDEDSVIGDVRWNPERKDSWWVRIQWWVRNPFHNLTHHVIGIYKKNFISTLVYKKFLAFGILTKMRRSYLDRNYYYWNYRGLSIPFLIAFAILAVITTGGWALTSGIAAILFGILAVSGWAATGWAVYAVEDCEAYIGVRSSGAFGISLRKRGGDRPSI